MQVLTPTQRRALHALGNGPLGYTVAGWSNAPLAYFPTPTVAALERLGLARAIKRGSKRLHKVTLTPRGRALLTADQQADAMALHA